VILIFSSIALFVTVFAFTVIALTIYNARQQDELLRANARFEAIQTLKHAIDHLTPLGMGDSLEWSNARSILEYAMTSIVFE
jgi:hypothetical protein